MLTMVNLARTVRLLTLHVALIVFRRKRLKFLVFDSFQKTETGRLKSDF